MLETRNTMSKSLRKILQQSALYWEVMHDDLKVLSKITGNKNPSIKLNYKTREIFIYQKPGEEINLTEIPQEIEKTYKALENNSGVEFFYNNKKYYIYKKDPKT